MGEAGQLNRQAGDWANIGASAGSTLGGLMPGGGVQDFWKKFGGGG
jgi:hypothetical protein